MVKQISPALPKTKESGMPEWYHAHGPSVCVREMDLEKPLLILASSSVEIVIQPHRAQGLDFVYEIRHPDRSVTGGTFWMCFRDFKAAFRMSNDYYEIWGAVVIEKYGGDVAHKGKYIRLGPYLNIPNPGTSSNEDPNVSIYVDDDIKQAAGLFLDRVHERMLCVK